MNVQKLKIYSWTILIIAAIAIQMIAAPQVLAHNPSHTGQDLGGGMTDPPPEEENPGVPDPKEGCEIGNEPGGVEQTDNPGDDGTEGDPIYLFDGKFFYYHTDLLLPGRIPLKVGRSYDSHCLYNGPFGFSWSFTYNVRVFNLSDGNLLLRRGSNNKQIFTSIGDNTYEGPAGNYEKIIINDDGTYTLIRKNGYEYQFDINGCLSAVEDRNGNSVRMIYDPAGKLPINGISPFSNITNPIVIAYDWRLIKVEEYRLETPTGRFIEFFYNDDGRITQISDSTGRQVLYTYDPEGNGDLLAMQDPEGNVYSYTYQNHLMVSYVGLGCSDCGPYTNTYDEEKRVTRQVHGNSVVDIDYLEPKSKTRVTTSIYDDETSELTDKRYEYYEFNSAGFVTKLTRQVGLELDEEGTVIDDIVTSYKAYTANNELTKKVDPTGSSTEYTYDNMGNILSETKMVDEDHTITTTYTYEPPYSRITSKEISSTAETQVYRTEYTYDDNGNLAMETAFTDANDPNTAITTSHTYNEYGDILTTTDPEGNVTTNEYDSYGFLKRTYYSDNPSHQTLYTYDARGNMLSTTDARGKTTTFKYDKLGRVVKVTNPLGTQTINTYEGAVLVKIEEGKTETEAGRISILEYDALNRKKAVKMLNDQNEEVMLVSYTYDSEGRVLTTTDGNGNTTTNTYDQLGRLIAVADPNGFTTAFEYDKAGNLILTTDAESNSTYYFYDYVNRLTDVIDALGNKTSYTYDAIGNILMVTDAKNNTTTHIYDGAGRLVKVIDPGGHTTLYGYDKNGNLIEKITPNEYSDPAGADPIVYSYDRYNKLTNINYPDGKAVIFTYDDVGNMTAWDDGHLSGSTIYDELNRPEKVTTNYPGFSKVVSYTYNRFGQRQTMTDGEGQITSYEYNALGRLTNIVHPSELITQYVYDNAGRLARKTLPNSVNTTYTYEVSGRLKQLVNTRADGDVISSFAYTHDRVGNRLSMTTLQGTHNYSYDETYQLISATHPDQPAEVYYYDPVGNRLISADYSNWTYDNCNRLLSYGAVTFTYDPSGNTTGKKDTQGTTTYTYDYENRMISATTPLHTAAYIYDPSGTRLGKTVDGAVTYYLYDNKDVIGEYDSSWTLISRYHHGQGIDEPIAMVRGGKTYYHTFDGLGSVAELTTVAGEVFEAYIYDSYGHVISVTENTNRYTYNSREYDVEIALYFYRARYYDPDVGRLLVQDPFMFSDRTNRYRYVRNNPLNLKDPYGLVVLLPPTGGPSVNWGYGNCCGPERRCEPGGNNAECPDKDGIDKCCRDHDTALAALGAKWWYNDVQVLDAHKRLINCVKNADGDPFARDLISGFFDFWVNLLETINANEVPTDWYGFDTPAWQDYYESPGL